MCRLLALLVLLLSLSRAPAQSDVDQAALIDIFGVPPSPSPGAAGLTPALDEVTRPTTDSSSMFTDANGDSCQCLPYYLCDTDLNGLDANNASVTGWGSLDIRFGEPNSDHPCTESVERCCKNPITSADPGQTGGQTGSQIGSQTGSQTGVQTGSQTGGETGSQTRPVTSAMPVQPRGCGYRNPGGLDFTLVGGSGRENGFGEYPWVVAILSSRDNSYLGVGVLIHTNVVMTGAHIATRSNGDIKIRAGEWDTQTTKERLPYQERLVEEIVIHEHYGGVKNLHNDIALLRLESAVILDAHINVICLPEQGEIFGNTPGECVANGWGKDKFGKPGRYAVIQKRVLVDIVPPSRCRSQLQRTRLGPKFKLHESFICAGGKKGVDTCEGDGGAPLVCPAGGDRFKLAGLVAWGIGCGNENVPAVYVNVPYFMEWVDAKVARWGIQLAHELD